MSARATAVLLGVLAALVIHLVVFDRPPKPAAPAPAPLLANGLAEATRVAVSWHATRLTAVRTAQGWRDERGHALPGTVVDDLLAALATVGPLGVLHPRPAEVGDYGFAGATTQLEVSAARRTLLALEIGARNPSWTGVYVRHRGAREVLLVGALLHWELEKLRAAASRPLPNVPGSA